MQLIETFNSNRHRYRSKMRGKPFRENIRNQMTRKRTTENDVVVSTGAAAALTRRKTSARTRAKLANTPAETLAAEPQSTTTAPAETVEIAAIAASQASH